jgi:hypothetical protein
LSECTQATYGHLDLLVAFAGRRGYRSPAAAP